MNLSLLTRILVVPRKRRRCVTSFRNLLFGKTEIMETLLVKEKVNAQHQVVIDLPDINAGEEVEIMVFFASTIQPRQTKKQPFDILKWAEQWESDFSKS